MTNKEGVPVRILESQFDGLVGPTHHYAGQSFGNQASMSNAHSASNPRQAALQGIKKAAFVRDLGIPQGMLPPVRRPRLETLHRLGYRGTDSEMIERAYHDSPALLSALYSASSMWVANSCTFSPSFDSSDGRAHFTPANLSSKFHRSVEAHSTASTLKQIFKGEAFVHHDPLPAIFGDEGAANHGRICRSHGERGLETFFYGKRALVVSPDDPKHFPARQSREASQAVARLHGLDEAGRIFLKQSAEAIDAGVFHNDVISVVNEDVYLVHEKTFFDGKESLNELKKRSADRGVDIECLVVTDDQVPLTDVIGSYLFNSQLLTLPSGAMVLIAPQECEARPNVKRAIDHLLAQSRRLEGAHYFDLKESMKNGGGPACLRLRLVLSESERAQVAPGVWLTLEMQNKLEQLIKSRYRDRLEVESLRDPQFYIETMRVFDELEQLFGLRLV